MLKVLLNQCLEFFCHLLFNSRLCSLEVLFKGWVLFVLKQSCLILAVKLEHVIALVV